MSTSVITWVKRYFSDPAVTVFWLFALFVVVMFTWFGSMLAPVLVSVVLAYLLQSLVTRLERFKVPHFWGVLIIYLAFIGASVIGLVWLLPLLGHQLSNLVNELPSTIGRGQAFLASFPERYPGYVSAEQIQQFLDQFKTQFAHTGQTILAGTLAQIPSVIALVVYLVLVPLLVYFFLMDRRAITKWFVHYLPKNRSLIVHVWDEVDLQIGNYVRGKVLEMFIVWIVTYIVFALMGLQYAMLLSTLVGISVVVPYIGAVVVTVPVVAIAFFQWGWSSQFAYLMIAYAVIIALDGNILVPLLFSEVISLHPVAIIIAVLVFGGLWGFWGIFFAIPLASLVKAIMTTLVRRA